jgi:outer membrane receptor protein involved in Fe transport
MHDAYVRRSFKWTALTSLLAVALTVQLPGQVSDVGSTDDSDVYELSVGYLATSSLAGSRLKTELRDVAAAISVITPEFLTDTGATNMESLLVYTTSTEVSGIYGNFGGNPESTRRSPDRQTRIRGLDGADVTRDFFLTDIPFDAYNVNQVDINRGANSVLFGLGSPAGIINYGLKTPNMTKNARNVEFRVGSFGSMRGSFDVDQVVLDRVLGVRVTGLQSEQKFAQDHKHDKARRMYAVARFTPKLGEGVYTEIQGTIESGRTRANRPSTTPPHDYISNWFGPLNKYVNNNNLHGYSVATIPDQGPYLANYQAGPGGNWWDSLGIVYADPKSGTVGFGDIGGFRQRGGPDNANGSWLVALERRQSRFRTLCGQSLPLQPRDLRQQSEGHGHHRSLRKGNRQYLGRWMELGRHPDLGQVDLQFL